MKATRSLLAAIIFAIAFLHAQAGVQFNFDAPVNCANYVAGGGTAVKFEIKSINYDTGVVRFMLLDADGNYLGGGAVFGITLSVVDQDAVKAAIVAEIASKG
jgi:hypothetical protein